MRLPPGRRFLSDSRACSALAALGESFIAPATPSCSAKSLSRSCPIACRRTAIGYRCFGRSEPGSPRLITPHFVEHPWHRRQWRRSRARSGIGRGSASRRKPPKARAHFSPSSETLAIAHQMAERARRRPRSAHHPPLFSARRTVKITARRALVSCWILAWRRGRRKNPVTPLPTALLLRFLFYHFLL